MLRLLEERPKKTRRIRKLFAILALTAASMTGAKSHVPLVRGIAIIRTLTNNFGVQTESPCIDVRDGAESNPAPTHRRITAAAGFQNPVEPSLFAQTDVTAAIWAFQQKVMRCVRSIRMFGQTDVCHKCVKRVPAETSSGLLPAQK